LPFFTERLAKLIGGIRAWETAKAGPAAADHTQTLSLLNKLSTALQTQKAEEINHILEELNRAGARQAETGRKPTDSKYMKYLEKISDDVLMTEFDSAIKTVEEFSASLREENNETR
jgi:hypothetical protein